MQEDWIPVPPHRPASIAFRNFTRDLGLRPSQDLSVDRIDPNGHYTKENTRWATQTIQGRNKRDTVMIADPDAPHSMIPVAELAQRLGLRYQTLRYRLKRQNLWPGD
jgi:hypothetical protein